MKRRSYLTKNDDLLLAVSDDGLSFEIWCLNREDQRIIPQHIV
jgi:hypothetical protein